MKHDDLKIMAKRLRLNVNTIEIDYGLSLFLTFLSYYPLKNNLVFKGGTSIKKTLFPEFRFSVDLDFTIFNDDNFENHMNTFFEDILKFDFDGFKFYKLKERLVREPNKGFSIFYHFDDEKENEPIHQPIKIDMNKTQKVLLDPEWRELMVRPYSFDLSDLSLGKTDGKIQRMQLREILAEKFHALFNPKRTKARDVYDIDYILSKEKSILEDKELLDLIKRKVEIRDGSLNLKTIEEKIEILRDGWNSDLKDLINDFPSFDEVKERVLTKMKLLNF